MTQEEKDLLLKDLCARLPYKCVYSASRGITHWNKLTLNIDTITKLINNEYDEIKPYLRPLSSMTEGEKKELEDEIDKDFKLAIIACKENDITKSTSGFYKIDWLNKNHFDYRGLIEKGLAIEAPEENNPYKD